MHAVRNLLFLYLTHRITAAAQNAQQEAVAACQVLESTSDDGTTTTISQFPNPSCWDTLQMTDWMTYWNTTTTICKATQSVHTPCQCRIDEPWATCFLRLTYAGNRTASYMCTDLTKPQNCTPPTPENVVQGPVQIFYGAYSIWSIFRYLAVWYTSLTSSQSLAAIKDELSKMRTSSVNELLASLIKDYGVEQDLSQALISIIANVHISSNNKAPTRPTLSNVQGLLGQLLQQVLEVLMSDWASGDFLTMASEGMLLNGAVESKKILVSRLGMQEKR